MIRWLLWLLGGLLLGGIVHLATVLLLPRTATQDAYTRLSTTAAANSIVPLPAPTPDDAVLPFMDPAFATAVCRYRSEEHTSELQSHSDLVCRLLLEKKKKKT